MHGNCKHHRCPGRFWKIGILVVAGILVVGYIVMLLWNWLMPALFSGAHGIGYLQALGLLVLSRILFGGLRHHGCHGRWRHHHRCHGLSEEERAKLKAAGCCGGKGAESSGPAAEQQKDD
ncbi:MAG TPA: hypothetical protein VKC56_12935 [Gallionellaceae bacterium]|nr:hypothetical protein [Gallionellaceae bacterium]